MHESLKLLLLLLFILTITSKFYMQTGCKPPVNHFIMNIYLKWKKYSLLKCENISFGICILIIISHDHKMETNVKSVTK